MLDDLLIPEDKRITIDLNELGNSNHKVPVLELPSSTDEIKKAMDVKVFDQPIRDRGLSIVGFVVESVTLDDESNKKIDNYELSSNAFMQQGTLTGAYANAVQDAAKNEAGAMNGFLGVGMMNMASGGMIGGVANNAMNTQASALNQQIYNPYVQNVQNQQSIPATGVAPVSGAAKFCSNCGNPIAGGNFCPNCGTKLN